MNEMMQNSEHRLVPREGGVLQRLLHIDVSAIEVNNDEVEVGVSRYSIHLFHFGD